MNSIFKELFKAIHEGKWVSIEYKNKEEEITKYWIGIKELDVKKRMLTVDGLHLSQYTSCKLRIFIDSILSASVIDGSYCPVNTALLEDIRINPHKYQTLFGNVANLKILNYLSDCNRMDTVPYECEYSLLRHFDEDKIKFKPKKGEILPDGNTDRAFTEYHLTDAQFKEIVKNFQYRAQQAGTSLKIKQLCLNVMSINFGKKGLYVLACRRLNLDVKNKNLRPGEEVTICREFTVDGSKQSIRKFLDAEDYTLLDNFEENAELIKDKITQNNRHIRGVDDMPYLISLGFNAIDLKREYNEIINMHSEGTVTYPIKAFFGDMLTGADRRKEYPPALFDRQVNLDQLRAIHYGMKYPLAYIQGPPGTGKTTTIINTIMTAFFNEKTVLFCSYNNHPIDGVFEKFQKIMHMDSVVPFPMVRLGNHEKVREALVFMKQIYEKTKTIKIYESTLEKNKGDKIQRTKELTILLKKREEILELQERREAIEKLLTTNSNLNFHVELEGRQLEQIKKRLLQIGEVSDEDARPLLVDDEEAFGKYLYYQSAKHIKRIGEEKNKELLTILYMEDKEKQVDSFNKYIENEDNLKKFLQIFPIVATTCISAYKLGEPKPYFDMVIMDEASQCNTAIALIPIIRGENLMLVGDPQQLNPVIVIDPKDNQILKKKYNISNEYDYIENSIYKVYLACDAVSEEVLLRYHYRCDKKIINFNNKKYYNNKLEILSKSQSENPLVYMEVAGDTPELKNTAPAEAEKIVEFAKLNKEKKIGVITPFANQKEYITTLLKENGLEHVTCGTVHAFQGDEKDVILFSLALTDKTHEGTYNWLKNYKELINVATSRAKEQLIVLSSSDNLGRLHAREDKDDIYELVEYVKTNGISQVTEKTTASRALGIKPYSTETEMAFLESLNHALGNILYDGRKYVVHKEVALSHIFEENLSYNDLFYTGRFDFVVYEKTREKKEFPVFAIELDGKEHIEDEIVKARDKKKTEVCREHGFELIHVENSYARRYNYIKDILIRYFSKR